MTATTRKEEILTDKQFMSIIEMVLRILSRSKDVEDAKKALLAIKYGEDNKP
jgi:transcription termination factor Rho